MSSYWIPYCTSHYRHEFCLKRAKELRESGKFLKVRVGSSFVERENGEKYSKIFVLCERG